MVKEAIQGDERIDELQKAVIALTNNHLSQKTENMSVYHKKLLQTVFGENILISNQIRDKMVAQRELVQFLLNDVAIYLFTLLQRRHKPVETEEQS